MFYFIIESILTVTYLITLLFLYIFLVGTTFAKNDHYRYNEIAQRISAILPIYREDTDIIKKCIDAISKQKGVALNLFVVVKDLKQEQIQLIKSYSKKFVSIKILEQNGKQSEIDAYKIALKHITTEYVCMLNVDAVLLRGSLNRLFWTIIKAQADVGFGLLFPRITTNFGKFTATDKLFRQLLLQKGRGALDMGYYITGPFYIIKTRLFRDELSESLSYDFDMSLKLYSRKNIVFAYLPIPLATELEKSSLIRWAVQYSRWVLGEMSLTQTFKRFFSSADTKIRIGFAGVLWVWLIMPLSFLAGIKSILRHLYFSSQTDQSLKFVSSKW